MMKCFAILVAEFFRHAYFRAILILRCQSFGSAYFRAMLIFNQRLLSRK